MKKEWINAQGAFTHLKAESLTELSDQERAEYKDAETAHLVAKLESLEESKTRTDEQAEELKVVKDALLKLSTEEFKRMKSDLKEMQNKLADSKKTGEKLDLTPFKEAIKGAENASDLIAKLSTTDGIEIKADATYADLTHGGQLDQMASGISDIVKKTPKLYQLFAKIPMNTETYTYLQQKAGVIRDAKNVAKCVKGFTSATKEEIEVVRTNDVKIKDTTDICLDYMDDFSYVEQRYSMLLSDSVSFKVDTQLLLGTNTGNEMNSINAVSSEFSAVNPDAAIGANIEDANMADLALAMATQIDVLGKLGNFKANVALVNKLDWFVKIESKKDNDGRYLDPRISKVSGNYYIGDLLVIAHVDVVPNTMYVFDSTKGAILDRKKQTLKRSTENGTNFVDEFITLMATVRLQFLVEQNHANAFMKCSDVDLAIDAIKLP